MKKLLKWLRLLDDNLVHIAVVFFIFATALIPKIPFQHVEYTYIKIRYDDLFPLIVGAVYGIQLLRGRIKINTQFLPHILLFWAAVFASFFIGAYVQNTIAVEWIGLLHSMRRVQYMLIFFVAAAATSSKQQFLSYMKLYLIALFCVGLYGLGQKFLQFPSIQSMNPAYVDGRLLFLNEEDRINSTFGGHFDLAAYLTFSMPIALAFFLMNKQKRYFALFVLCLIILLYTAARSSFIAYIFSITAFLLYIRRFKLYLMVLGLTAILMLVTGDMTKRFLQTFQLKTVYVNTETGGESIDQKISVKELPAGGYQVPLVQKFFKGRLAETPDDPARLKNVAVEEALNEAERDGRKLNTSEIEKRAAEISKLLKPQRTLLCDISCATRLQVEWPRAIGAFLYNPLFGSGPSSITEATDNDLLRWLGELGLIGAGVFIWLLIAIVAFVRASAQAVQKDERVLFHAFAFGLLALLVNSLYVDVFEASKVAYNFWLVAGLYVGVSHALLPPRTKR